MIAIARKPATLTLILLCLSAPRALEAQRMSPNLRTRPHLGIGYVASIPNMLAGVSAMGLTPSLFGGAGFYADVKFTTTSPGRDPYYYPDFTIDTTVVLGDAEFSEKSVWLSIDAALVYTLSPEFAVYAGAGYSKKSHYREYYDDTHTRGDFGFYWVSDPEGSGNYVNFLGGVYFRLARNVLFQAGAEAQPPGATVGLTLAFPL